MLAFVDEFTGEFAVPHKLLKANEREDVGADVEESHETEHDENQGEVDVEAFRYEIHYIQVAHDLGEGAVLLMGILAYMTVHVSHAQKIQTNRGRQSAKKPGKT